MRRSAGAGAAERAESIWGKVKPTGGTMRLSLLTGNGMALVMESDPEAAICRGFSDNAAQGTWDIADRHCPNKKHPSYGAWRRSITQWLPHNPFVLLCPGP